MPSLLDDVWRMTRRQEKAVEDLEKIQAIGAGKVFLKMGDQIEQAKARLSKLYKTLEELQKLDDVEGLCRV